MALITVFCIGFLGGFWVSKNKEFSNEDVDLTKRRNVLTSRSLAECPRSPLSSDETRPVAVSGQEIEAIEKMWLFK